MAGEPVTSFADDAPALARGSFVRDDAGRGAYDHQSGIFADAYLILIGYAANPGVFPWPYGEAAMRRPQPRILREWPLRR